MPGTDFATAVTAVELSAEARVHLQYETEELRVKRLFSTDRAVPPGSVGFLLESLTGEAITRGDPLRQRLSTLPSPQAGQKLGEPLALFLCKMPPFLEKTLEVLGERRGLLAIASWGGRRRLSGEGG